MGVSKLIVSREEVSETLKRLEAEGYAIKVFYPGTAEHLRQRLGSDKVLIHAWKPRERRGWAWGHRS